MFFALFRRLFVLYSTAKRDAFVLQVKESSIEIYYHDKRDNLLL